MWTIYSERLSQTPGTWAYATVGGGLTCVKTGHRQNWVKDWKVQWWVLRLRGQEHLWPPGEPPCDGFWLCQDSRGLRTAVDLWLCDCHFKAWGHLAEGWEWVGTALIRPTIVQFDQERPSKSWCSCKKAWNVNMLYSVLWTSISFTSWEVDSFTCM